jgi:hypothetical protein
MTTYSLVLNQNQMSISPKLCILETPRYHGQILIFTVNGNSVECINCYQYLGLLLTEFLDYQLMAKAVAKSASIALGLLIVKSKIHGGFQHTIFSKLYDIMVWSAINYGSCIWGTRDFSCMPVSSPYHQL